MTAGIGTPAYMAVELITAMDSHVQCSNSIDVFSMGVLMWSMWTLEVPYAKLSLTPFLLMKAILDGLRPELPDDCPPQLAGLLGLCWHADPQQRPTFSEITRRLELIFGSFDASNSAISLGLDSSGSAEWSAGSGALAPRRAVSTIAPTHLTRKQLQSAVF